MQASGDLDLITWRRTIQGLAGKLAAEEYLVVGNRC
jgi:hypothetical protein